MPSNGTLPVLSYIHNKEASGKPRCPAERDTILKEMQFRESMRDKFTRIRT